MDGDSYIANNDVLGGAAALVVVFRKLWPSISTDGDTSAAFLPSRRHAHHTCTSPPLGVEVPRLKLVEVDLPDDVEIYGLISNLLPQVVVEQFLVRRVEPETRRNASYVFPAVLRLCGDMSSPAPTCHTVAPYRPAGWFHAGMRWSTSITIDHAAAAGRPPEKMGESITGR
uniref:Uncharacterized protein n=1 Tax=Oryza punctata TaxID=4537 RepID=A0A0E0JY08_ORYPU